MGAQTGSEDGGRFAVILPPFPVKPVAVGKIGRGVIIFPMRESIEIKDGADVVSVRVRLHAHIGKEKPGMYVSYCPALDLYSQGATAKEARANIIEATRLFIESCFARGTLRDVLRESGFCLAI